MFTLFLGAVVVDAAAPTREYAVNQLLYVTTANGQITTPRPDGGRIWQWTEGSRDGDGYTLTEIKWQTTFNEGDLYLYAKDYARVQETTASICSRDWRAYYRPVLPVISLLQATQSPYNGHGACNVVAEGSSPARIRLRLDEHYIVLPDHVLLLSAAGPTERVLALKAEIDVWFSGIRFKALQGL